MAKIRCEVCGDQPILYLVRVLNTETGREMWVCMECVELN